MAEISDRASNDYLIRQVHAEGLRNLQTFTTRAIVSEVAAKSSFEVAQAMSLYGEVLRSNYRNRRGRMTRINKEVGLDAQQRTLDAYDKRVNRKKTPAYRANASGKWKRYAGGRMRKAIADPQFFRASYDGIFFGNQNVMDRQAKQWFRLNFGAGPRAKSGPYRAGEYRLRFFGEATGAPVTLRGYGTAAGYSMPKGLFLNPTTGVPRKLGGSRGDIFHPRALPLRTRFQVPSDFAGKIWSGGPTQGFGGFHFLDSGMKRIAQIWPIGITRMIQEWVEEAGDAGTGPVAKVAVPKTELAAISRTLNREMDRLRAQQRNVGFIGRLGG